MDRQCDGWMNGLILNGQMMNMVVDKWMNGYVLDNL